MVDTRFACAHFPSGSLLILAGTLLLTPDLAGQTTSPTQGTSIASTQLPIEVQAKLNKLKADLKTAEAAGDTGAEAKALNKMGDAYSGISEYQKARDTYNQALLLSRAAKDAQEEAAALNGIGASFCNQSQNDKALEFFQQALTLATGSGDPRGHATALTGLGWVDSDNGEDQKALDFYSQALPLAEIAKDPVQKAKILRRIGIVYRSMGNNQKALDYLDQALLVARGAADGGDEAAALISIGNTFPPNQKALEYYKEALPIFRSLGDHNGEAKTLYSSGVVYYYMGEQKKALDSYAQALALFQKLGDRRSEASTLNNIGGAYTSLGENQKALDSYIQALPIRRVIGDRKGEVKTLDNVGECYRKMGELQKALDYYDQSLTVARAVGDRGDEAATLTNVGSLYDDLGEKQKALDYYNQALPIYRAVGDRLDEATTLDNIGNVYVDLGEHEKALDYLNQAIPIHKEVGDRDGEATTLGTMGRVYDDLGEEKKALEAYTEALSIFQAIGDRLKETTTLDNIGTVHRAIGEIQKALDFYNQALRTVDAVGDPLLEAAIFRDMMNSQKQPQPKLATFYGKQAVNLLQQVRGNIKGLDKALQSSFIASKNDYYHDLADLLISQGRLPEAEQVLDLLKEQEYSDYVRGETVNTLRPLTLTPAEKQAEEDYQKSTAQLVSLGERWAQLKKISLRTSEQEKEYQQISDQLDAASKGLNDYYARLYELFGKDSDANKQVADVKGDVSVLKQTIAKMPHTVALYTLVGKDRTRVIVITGSATVAREYLISEADLNKKVADFQQVLRDPSRDPRPMAQELYKVLLASVKADLNQADAQTLVWSLDGVLRYVPLAALYDGKQFVVEKYNTVTITPASIGNLAEKPDVSKLTAAAMGISQKYEDGLSALPAVVGELDDVVKDRQVKAAHGALPGTILLNGQFTETAMESQLGSRHAVVHIASHFVFKPGDDSQSYLLLAGKDTDAAGYHLTVADFRDNQKLELNDTDLLTLSACETGMSGNASNGREVDGLGTTAQLKGAKAVISSLWEVNDASTGQLMGDFYNRWAEGAGKVTKVEALRQAQLDLLLGKTSEAGGAYGRGFFGVKHEEGTLPKGYAHPYYWAPFVLMGNWR